MSGVVCLYGWEERRVRELSRWAQKEGERYVVVLTDAAPELVLPKVHIFAPTEEAFRQIAWQFLFLPFAYEAKEPALFDSLKQIQAAIQYVASDFVDQGIPLIKNMLSNAATDFSRAEELFGRFTGVPVIVCGAGPSLQKALPQLQELQSSAIIIAGGAAVDILRKGGVTPHFVVHVDSACAHTIAPSAIPVFFQLRTDAKVLQGQTGIKLLLRGSGNIALEGWLEGEGRTFDGGWTVGTLCAALAYELGCNPIVIVGMDFSLPTSRPDMEPVVGTTLFARPDWILGAHWLDRFARERPDRTWIDGTGKGLGFPHIAVKPLSEIRWPPFTFALPLLSLHTATERVVELETSLVRSLDLVTELLKEIEKKFPAPPQRDAECLLLDHALSEELAYEKVLLPVWEVWRHVIIRRNTDGEHGLYVHRALFFLNLLTQALHDRRTLSRH